MVALLLSRSVVVVGNYGVERSSQKFHYYWLIKSVPPDFRADIVYNVCVLTTPKPNLLVHGQSFTKNVVAELVAYGGKPLL